MTQVDDFFASVGPHSESAAIRIAQSPFGGAARLVRMLTAVNVL
jgi:hypothetical protein